MPVSLRNVRAFLLLLWGALLLTGCGAGLYFPNDALEGLVVDSISPTSGNLKGRTAVTIRGAGFGSNTTVTIGGVACTVTNVTATEIACTTQRGTPGFADVSVSRGSVTATLSSAFTYVPILYSFYGGPSIKTIRSNPISGIWEEIGSAGSASYPGAGYASTAPSFAIDSTNTYLYAFQDLDCVLSTFSISSSDGSLTWKQDIPVGIGWVGSVLIHPSGRFLYLGQFADNFAVHAYSINASTGLLTSIADYSPGEGAEHLLFDPTGNYLFSLEDNLNVYRINTSTGTLTPLSSRPTGAGCLKFDAVHNNLYVNSPDDGTLRSFQFDSSTGALVEAASSPYTIIGSFPGNNVGFWDCSQAMAMDSQSKFLYAVNYASPPNSFVYKYQIGANGNLTSLGSQTVGDYPVALYRSTADVLYVGAGNDSRVHAFNIGAGGGLTALTGSPLSVGSLVTHFFPNPNGTVLHTIDPYAGTVFDIDLTITNVLSEKAQRVLPNVYFLGY